MEVDVTLLVFLCMLFVITLLLIYLGRHTCDDSETRKHKIALAELNVARAVEVARAKDRAAHELEMAKQIKLAIERDRKNIPPYPGDFYHPPSAPHKDDIV